MLPKRKKDKSSFDMQTIVVGFLHGGYWLIYLLLLLIIFAIAETQIRKIPPSLLSLFPLITLCIIPNLVSFYSFYFLLFSRFLSRKKFLALLLSGAVVSILSAFLGVFVSVFFFGFKQPIFTDIREFFFLIASLFVIATIHGGVALVIRGFVVWYDEIKLKEELAQRNFEMELMLIKSQINPHFLFNTINNIDVLITKNSNLASEYLNKLSDILRYMVYETKAEKIPLVKELDYIKKYIELQKIRTTNPNYVNFEVQGDANNLVIAPMSFFPFIENAFKHTENKKNQHSIFIKVLIEKNQITFECKNPYQPALDKKHNFGGVGNELIKKRMMLIYPDKHSLKITDDNGVYTVNLMLYGN